MDITRFIKNIISKTGFTVVRTNITPHPQSQKQITPRHFFDLYFSQVDPKDFFFVQIGANDGKSRDLMYRYVHGRRLSGVLVEPQKDVFEKLKEAYVGVDTVQFANIAISEKSGQQTFYKVKKSLINERNYFETTAIASFNKDVFLKTLRRRIPKVIEKISDNIEDYIEEENVDALSFSDFVRKYNIVKIDFLFLDCEGYDFQIIKMIDFSQFSPKIINFESKFLSDVDRQACETLLASHGYQLFRHGNDTCAFR